MGACYGKGAGPKDPDKVPYTPTAAAKKGKKSKGQQPQDTQQTTQAENGAKLTAEADDNENDVVGSEKLKDVNKDQEQKDDTDGSELPVLTPPVVAHLPPVRTSIGRSPPPKDDLIKGSPSTESPPVTTDDVNVKVEEKPKEPSWRKPSPSAWKPAPVSPIKSSFTSTSPTRSSFTPTAPPQTFPNRTSADMKVETHEKAEEGMTVTVQTKTITREEQGSGLENMRLPSFGEPIDPESIIKSIREKTWDSGITMSSESTTTTVVKKIDSKGKEIVDVVTKETKYDGPRDDKTADVFVKTTSKTYSGSVETPTELHVKPVDVKTFGVSRTTTESFIKSGTVTTSSVISSGVQESTKTHVSPIASPVKQEPTHSLIVNKTSSSNINSSVTTIGSTGPTTSEAATIISPVKETKLEDLIIREEAESKGKPSPSPAPPKVDSPKEPSPLRSPTGIPSSTKTSGLPSPTTKTSLPSPRSSVSPDKQRSGLPTFSPTRITPPVTKDSLPKETQKPSAAQPIELNVSTRKASSASSASSSSNDYPNGHLDAEPVPKAKLRETIMGMMSNFTPERQVILDSHTWCENSRSRLMGCIDKWANGEDKEKENFKRVWAVTGKPGMGKTALAAEVARRHVNHLAGAQFFHFCSPNLDLNDARCVLESFAYEMCSTLPNYANMLPEVELLQEILERGDLGEMFDVLIAQPLMSPQLGHDPNQTILVILDAVDECNRQTRQQLLQLINAFSDNTPEWLYLLITTRDENPILALLDNVRTIELKNSNDNLSDIKRYLKEPLGKHMDRISLDGGLTQLVKKTDGNFLCAKFLGKLVDALPADKSVALREVDGLFPKGVNGIYQQVFKKLKDIISVSGSPKESEIKYQKFIGLLCSILEPISEDVLDILKINKEVLVPLMPLLDTNHGYVSFYHKHTVEWLLNEQESNEHHIAIGPSRQRLADLCLTWLDGITNASSKTSKTFLEQYALKRAIAHLLDAPKQQEQVAGLLCELKFIQKKLDVPGVSSEHLLSDYRHSHYQCNNDTYKLVTMSEYMKRFPKLLDQMKLYYEFVKHQGQELETNPDFTLHMAANYSSCDRIQQNARVELEGKQWIEELTALPETHNISKSFPGQIESIDISPDGKILALISRDEDYNLSLFFINVATCEKRTEPVDIKMVKDRVGLMVRFISDGTAAFIGSISTFISTRQGKPMPTGIDVNSVQLKEKYSIECCDISKKFMVCGLSTFPWGGRSLHLSVMDLKAKKCVKTLEVLKFRFGGSSQFGVKGCAISEDESMMCASVKQSNKAQLTCSIYCLSKWTVLHSVTQNDIEGEIYTRCSFVNNDAVLLGTSLRSVTADSNSHAQETTKLWKFKDEKEIVSWNTNEVYSIFNTYKNGYIAARWYIPSSTITIETWAGKGIESAPKLCYTIRGVERASDIVASGDQIIIVTSDEMKLYNINDLEIKNPGEKEVGSLLDILVRGVTFHPRSDEAIISHITPGHPDITISTTTPTADDLSLSKTTLNNMITTFPRSIKKSRKCFHGFSTKLDICQTNSDGSFLVFNTGTEIKIWNRSSDTVNNIPPFHDQDAKMSSGKSSIDCVLLVVSQKDNTVAVLYPQNPGTIYIFDLKSQQQMKKLELPGTSTPVSDFTFMPSNGHLVSYYQDQEHTLATWNQRTGGVVSKQQGLSVSYVHVSPASDRLVLSLRKTKDEGSLVLRNTDNKFNTELSLSSTWLPSNSASDLEFSVDGTIVVGVCTSTSVCRVWNAGNGEVLKDLDLAFNSSAEVVGMITNTHVIFNDDCLRVVDIGSGDVTAVLPLDGQTQPKTAPLGLKVSPKGNIIVGANHLGQVRVYQFHNFSAVKRKTTLQRMKSFTKP